MIILSLDKCQLLDALLDTYYNCKQCLKIKFNYNKMTSDIWSNFATLTDSLTHQYTLLCFMNDQSITNLT